MSKIIHRAESRGVADHGWLYSRHTFSFASYYDPDRMGFGKLRVVNDDLVKGGAGFGAHPHDNMEIVSVPLAGALRHRDSMGNTHVIRAGEVQIMSAGTGLTHSEYNDSATEAVNFLQIWVLPKERDIEPRYGQKAFDQAEHHNRFLTVVAPERGDETVWINQDAWLSLGNLDAGRTLSYTANRAGHGLYLFVIEGQIEVADETLGTRDAIGITDAAELAVGAGLDSWLLMIEVPMT
ncbi:MAG: pirin family protein [Gammaproteobacteria bacterium]|jgi:redox-sensitive bicupin YhaK (pirin superfamily)